MLAPGFVPRSTAVAAHLSQQQGPGVGEESIKPMDLSSGGLAALSSFLRCRAEPQGMPIQGSPEINVQRLAELVRLQQRENEDKRKWDDEEEDEEVVEAEQPVQLTQERPVSSPSPPTACISPPAPPSPGAGSSSGSESGREEKRRRLDLLLHKKFESVTAGCGSPPSLNHEPPSDLQPPRRGSQGSGRRKQAHPSSPGPTSPPSISLRPPADLFPPPPAAASSPR